MTTRGATRATAATAMTSVMEAAPVGMLVANAEGTILLVNSLIERMFGYPREELVGAAIERLVPERLRAPGGRRPGGRRPGRSEAGPEAGPAAGPAAGLMGIGVAPLGLRRDGTEFPLEVTLRPFPTADGARTIVSVRDASAQADADLRLIEAKRAIAVLDDRQRIARDLHDRIAQRIFAAGTALQSVLARTDDPLLRDQLQQALTETDAAILDLRSTQFGLAAHGPAASLRARVLEVCAEMRTALGVAPSVRFLGRVEKADAAGVDALLPVLREALSRAARSGRPAGVAITVSAEDGIGFVVDVSGIEQEVPAGRRVHGGAGGRGAHRLQWRASAR